MSAGRPPIVALDLDGTLIDCEQRQVQLMAFALQSSDSTRVFDAPRFWSLKRGGANNIAALRSLAYDEPTISAATQLWNGLIETAEWLQRDVVLPGVVEGLIQLATLGYERHLLSARHQPHHAHEQLRTLGLTHLLEAVSFVAPSSASSAKAEYLLAHPCALFVGDAESDFAASQLSDTPFIAVSTGQRSAEYLAQAGVASVYASFAEVLRRWSGSGSVRKARSAGACAKPHP